MLFRSARSTFQDLISTMPDSDLADRAHLNLGNFLFQVDSKFDEAIAEYQKVYDKGDASPYYQEAIYQLAWAKYKLSRYDEALTLFVQLLDLSERDKADTGKESSYAKDAIRFMAFSFADQAQIAGVPAVRVADAYFKKIGPREYERRVYIQLADVLMRVVEVRDINQRHRFGSAQSCQRRFRRLALGLARFHHAIGSFFVDTSVHGEGRTWRPSASHGAIRPGSGRWAR